jgi:hypothetical protein
MNTARGFAAMAVVAAFAGCGAAPQLHSSEEHQVISLNAGDLDAGGVALITPSTVTGQEEERQSVALTFAKALTKERPAMRVVTFADAVGMINRAGLADDYRRMYQEYRDTGIFRRDTLRRVGEVTGTRYLAQLKLSGFQQESSTRLGVLGLRLIDTKRASVRLYLQIWDATEGTVAWEGLQETAYSEEQISEEQVTLRTVLSEASVALAQRLP